MAMKTWSLVVACLALAHCVPTTARVIVTQPRVAGKDACEDCMFAFRLIDDVLNDDVVVNYMVKTVEDRLCPAIHGGPKCQNMAEGLVPVILQWLKAPATSWGMCKAMGTCTESSRQFVTVARQVVQGDASQCAMCQLVIAQVQRMLNDSTVLDKLNQTAQQACQMLPADMSASCAAIVSKYEPFLVTLITQAHPKDLCAMVGVCDAQLASLSRRAMTEQELQSARLMSLQPAIKSVQPGRLGDSCDMCKMAVIEVHSLVANKQIQDSVVNYTKTLCEQFPSFTDTCQLYVDTYAPMVFTLLQQYLVPDVVCTEIGVCQKSSLPEKPVLVVASKLPNKLAQSAA